MAKRKFLVDILDDGIRFFSVCSEHRNNLKWYTCLIEDLEASVELLGGDTVDYKVTIEDRGTETEFLGNDEHRWIHIYKVVIKPATDNCLRVCDVIDSLNDKLSDKHQLYRKAV